MNYRLSLENVSNKYGAPMGRAESLPEDRNQPILPHLVRVRLDSGGYDRDGAYWGVERSHYVDQSLIAADLHNEDGEATLNLALISIRQFFTSTENFEVHFLGGRVRFTSHRAGKDLAPYRVYLQIQE